MNTSSASPNSTDSCLTAAIVDVHACSSSIGLRGCGVPLYGEPIGATVYTLAAGPLHYPCVVFEDDKQIYISDIYISEPWLQ